MYNRITISEGLKGAVYRPAALFMPELSWDTTFSFQDYVVFNGNSYILVEADNPLDENSEFEFLNSYILRLDNDPNKFWLNPVENENESQEVLAQRQYRASELLLLANDDNEGILVDCLHHIKSNSYFYYLVQIVETNFKCDKGSYIVFKQSVFEDGEYTIANNLTIQDEIINSYYELLENSESEYVTKQIEKKIFCILKKGTENQIPQQIYGYLKVWGKKEEHCKVREINISKLVRPHELNQLKYFACKVVFNN